MLAAVVVTRSIPRDADALYELVWRPESFPRWASGLGGAALEHDGQGWTAQQPEVRVRITFTGHNPFRVMDHRVETGDGQVIAVPMRIVANGAGSEVMLTLFRQPGMTAERFAADRAWVERDLAALAEYAEAALPRSPDA